MKQICKALLLLLCKWERKGRRQEIQIQPRGKKGEKVIARDSNWGDYHLRYSLYTNFLTAICQYGCTIPSAQTPGSLAVCLRKHRSTRLALEQGKDLLIVQYLLDVTKPSYGGAERQEKTDCSRGGLQITGVKAHVEVKEWKPSPVQHSSKDGKSWNRFLIRMGKHLSEGEPGRRKPVGKLIRDLQWGWQASQSGIWEQLHLRKNKRGRICMENAKKVVMLPCPLIIEERKIRLILFLGWHECMMPREKRGSWCYPEACPISQAHKGSGFRGSGWECKYLQGFLHIYGALLFRLGALLRLCS